MRNVTKLMTRTACAAVAFLGAFFAPAASAQTDQLIVRNERIGAVRLGMTAAEVIAALGQPGETGFWRSEEGYLVYCDGPCTNSTRHLSVWTWGTRNEVFRIFVKGGAYATSEGVSIGMSEMDVRIRMGSPTHRVWDEDYNYGWKLYYPGLLVIVDEARGVNYIEICQPRRQRRASGRGFWCE
jgi:hypothetical protein